MNLIRADLCRALGISEGTVRNWKKGVMPAADTALKIADYLQVSVSWLVSGQGEKLQHSYREMSESLSEIANKNSPIDANNGLYSVLLAKIDKLPARPQND